MAGSLAGGNCANSDQLASDGSNLSDDESCGLSAAGDQQGSGATVALGPIQDNGGPTLTMLPGPTSDAIDAADCADSSELDQRQLDRPATSCDIGAVEVGASLTPVQLYAVYNQGPIIEGESVEVGIVASGPPGASLTYAFDCDNDGTYDITQVGDSTAVCSFSSYGSYTVDVSASDGTTSDTGSTTVQVWSSDPTLVTHCIEDRLEAALAAVHASGGGSITFDCTGIIEIHDAKIINTNVTIVGNGEVVFDGSVYGIFRVSAIGSLNLIDLTLQNGIRNGFDETGGAIRNHGVLQITDSTFVGNVAIRGGAIANHATASISSSTFRNNSAIPGGSALGAGRGGAIINFGSLKISASTFTNNTADRSGGAIHNYSGGTLDIVSSTFGENESWNEDGTYISDGGAITNDGTAHVTASTFRNNLASRRGGAVRNLNELTVVASTFTGNRAFFGGGAISNRGIIGPGGILEITSSTFSNDSSRGASISNGLELEDGVIVFSGSVSVQSTIFFSVTSDCFGPIASGGYNLSNDESCGLTATGDQQGSDVTVALGPLQDNGGPMMTMRPGPTSDAIDAADCSVSSPQDQRGVVRPIGTACDIGAVEVADVIGDIPVQIFGTYNDGPAYEGEPVEIGVVAYDPSGDGLSYAFDCNSDGGVDQAGLEPTASCTYDAAGSYTVLVVATNGVTTATGETTVTVLAVLPEITWLDLSPENEGAQVSLAVGIENIEPAATHSCSFDWGDGVEAAGTVNDANTACSASHIYADDGDYDIEVCVTDDDGDRDCEMTSVVVDNVAPEITNIASDSPIDEGSSATIVITASDPAGVNDPLTYGVDCDGDGAYEISGSSNEALCSFADNGEFTVGIQVADDDGGSTTATTVVIVNNVDPSIRDVTSDSPVDEGSPVTVIISASDPGGASDPLTYSFDCDNDGSYDTTGTSNEGQCTFSDNGSFTIGVQVADDDGGSTTESTTITVNNIDPLVDAGANASIDEGSSLSREGSFTDPGADTWTATVDYGDGSGVQPLALAGSSFTLNHAYTDGVNDPYTVTVCVSDDDGGAGCDSFVVEVLSASEQIALLVTTIDDMGLSKGIEKSLLDKLADVEASIAAGLTIDACNQLGAFSNQVEAQTGKKLSEAEADQIMDAVNRISAALGCA